MFTYRCPGCGKHHAVDRDFEQPFEAKCLRCGVGIAVTAELIHQSQASARSVGSPATRAEAITRTPAVEPVPLAKTNGSVAEAEEHEPALAAAPSSESVAITKAEPAKNGRTKGKEQQQEKPSKKKPAKRADKPEQTIEGEEEDETPLSSKPAPLALQAPPGAKTSRPRWQIIVAIASVVLVVGGACSYLIFGGSKPAPSRAAKKANPTRKPTPKPQPPEKEPEPPPPTPELRTRDVAISAARLSSQLAVDAYRTNLQYADKVLDVSGLFEKIEKKNGLRPTPQLHVVFVTEGTAISGNIQGSRTELAAWTRLVVNQPFTLRGRYEKDGYLRDCILLPFTPSADVTYKDKMMEVSGRVAEVAVATNQQPFPSVRLEGETNSVLAVRCLFRNTDAEEVKKIHPGALVTIRGKCAGAEKSEGTGYVRFDNCELVYSSAPLDGAPRREAACLLREYEEDRHPYYLPPPGEEERIDPLLTIRTLATEQAADAKAFDKKYLHRLLYLTGIPRQTRGNEGIVYLESGYTDLAFRIECRFTKSVFETVRALQQPEYRVVGLCTGMTDKRTLRLDNCRIDMPRPKGPVLTADYLPHCSGRSFTVDVATFDVPVTNRKRGDLARREVHVQGKDGGTEIFVTHAGVLTGKSLFAEGVQEEWVKQNKTRLKRPTSSGLYFQRLKAGFVEIGTPYLDDKGKTEISWRPILKLGVQAGDKWTCDPPDGNHEYVLEKFDDYHGQPCAVVREVFRSRTDVTNIFYPIEILHVYVKGLGEVERREWRRLDQRDGKKSLSEMKRVEPSPLERDSSSKPAGGKPPVPVPPSRDDKPRVQPKK